jgi:Na+/proline symporter
MLEQSRLSGWDLCVIAFYFIFMFMMGFAYRSFNKGTSDYFRGGGKMLWWMVGATAFMTQFSAWTFTGAAGKAYQDGALVATIFVGNALGYLINYLLTAVRFRRMRTVTPIDGVRDRFGPANEQLFTWSQIPMSIVYSGIWLNGLAIVASGAFGLPIDWTIVVVGLAVLVVSVAGGAWAVIASDFVQLLILMCVAVVLAIATLYHPDVGGFTGLTSQVPAHFFQVTLAENAGFVWIWIITAMIVQPFKLNNIFDSYRYLSVKDERNAKKAALLAFVLMLIGPIIWFVPPMAARVLQPDMASEFPNLSNPSEGAYIYMGFQVLPAGMIGLLVCGLFAATMSSMDSGLNRNAGILVRNFYHPVLRKRANDSELLLVGKISSIFLGLVIIGSAIIVSRIEEFDLFEIMTLFGSLIAIPYCMPLVWGLFVKKVPAWTGWSTVVVGMAFSAYVKWGNPAALLGYGELAGRELSDFMYAVSGIGNVIVCTIWFFATMPFYKYESEEYKRRAEGFFERQRRPVHFASEEGVGNEAQQGKVLGGLMAIYGAFMVLLALVVPQDSWWDRLAYVFVAATMCSIAYGLYASGKKWQEHDARMASAELTNKKMETDSA